MIALASGVASSVLTVALVAALVGSNSPKAHPPAATAAKHTVTNPHRPTGGRPPLTPCQQNPNACTTVRPVISGPTAYWLGMQIVTSPAGIVISTVRLGSEADQAGLEPGDDITEIDGQRIDSIDQIRRAAAKIRLGRPVVINVFRSSVAVPAASLPMTERPTIRP